MVREMCDEFSDLQRGSVSVIREDAKESVEEKREMRIRFRKRREEEEKERNNSGMDDVRLCGREEGEEAGYEDENQLLVWLCLF